METPMKLYIFGILGALYVQLYKNIKILTHNSLIIHESENVLNGFALSSEN